MTFDELMAAQARQHELGPTGEYPLGPVNNEDQGTLQIAISQEDGKVFVNFGAPVSWLAMTPDHADAIAAGLRDYAASARRHGQSTQEAIN